MKTKCGRAGRVLLAAALAALLLLTGCASKSRKAAQRLELGQKYLTEMNYTEAVAAFTQVIRLMPENIPAYLGRAEAYVGLEQYEEAKSDYTTVIEKSEKTNRPYTEVQGYMGRANVNELLQENSEALSDYEAAKSLLEQVDWDKFKQVTEKIIRDLLDRIEEACRRLRELLGMEEDTDTEEPGGEDIFQSAMDSLTTDSKYADSRKYVLPADYDGDGRVEAFGFFGSRMDTDGLLVDLQVYFIDPDGNAEKVTEIGGIDGAPKSMESEDQTDFSDSLMKVNSHIYAVFSAAPQDVGEYFAVLLGVRNGRYTVEEMGGIPTVRDDGLVVAPDLGFDTIYQEKDGRFEEVGTEEPDTEDDQTTEPDQTPVQNGSVSLEQAWAQTMQSIMPQGGWAGSGYSDYFLPADYDGDGKQEAFAVCGDFKDGLAENFQIFFISSDGTVTRQNTEGLMGGRVFNYENYDGTSDSVLVKAGSRRVFVWEMPGAGNMPTVFFGVKNGQPYVLDISWQYAWFIEDDGHYYVDNGRYDEGSHEIEYNASTWQFELNGNVKYY